MATSGTFTFNPSLGDFVTNAFAKCGVRRTELTTQHMQDANFEANLLMTDWAADGINLWMVQSATIPLFAGQVSYALPSTITFLLDLYVTQGGFDRLLYPISRSDYASLAQKDVQGYPTSYWYDKLLSPNLYVWPLANADNTYTLTYYYMQHAQDSVLSNGTQQQIPWEFYSAFASGLAARLSYIYAPDKAQLLQAKADRDWLRAQQVGTENVPMTMNVGLASYFR